jgi:inosine/xanthosine triphosphatase
MKIVVASKNPVKLQAALNGFTKMFPTEKHTVEGVSVDSGVSDQPATDAETYQGAYNRALNASRAVPDADFWVGLEGGIEAKAADMEAYAWMVVRSSSGQIGKGKTGTYFLPPAAAELIRQGKELGEVSDILFDTVNSKHDTGTTGLLTGGILDRTEFYSAAIIFALIPFKNPALYPATKR